MPQACVPRCAVGDGALGLWAALDQVFPQTRQQRCWNHKTRNVVDKVPKKSQAEATDRLRAIAYAESAQEAEQAKARFVAWARQKGWAKAAETLERDWERMLTFYDFPKEHWIHLRTTNIIESPFATVRLRERATRGAGSRTKGLLMAFKLLEMAQLRWRHLDGAQLLPLVREGVKFADGVQVDPRKQVTQSTDNQPREAA